MNVPWEALVALLTYIIASTLGFVWWMATQTIKLEFALTALKEITNALAASEANFATKVDMAKELVIINKNMDKAWTEIDKLRDIK